LKHLKKYLRGIRFEDDEAVNGAVNGWLESQSADFSFQGIVCLLDKWDKCIHVRGDYIEKLQYVIIGTCLLNMLVAKLFQLPSY